MATRFIGYGWNVMRVGDANDLDMLERALSRRFQNDHDRPTLIIVDSHIAYGSPNKQDTHAAHGEPLGEDEIKLTKRILRLAGGRQVPRARRSPRTFPRRHRASAARSCATRGSRCSTSTRRSIPELAEQLERMQHRQLPEGWDKDLPTVPADAKGHGQPRCVGQGAQRAGQERALAASAVRPTWRLRRRRG